MGAGGVAARHAQVLTELGEHVAFVSDIDADRARLLADDVGATAVPDIEAVLAGGVDAVYVCVPPFAHGAIEERVIDAGLPLFVEKPLSRDLVVAERLATRIAASGTITATGYHWRYLDTLERARRLVADRPAVMATASWIDKVPPPAWWTRRSGSGGQVIEQATHVLDVLRVLCGELTVLAAWSRRVGHAGEADDPDVVDDLTHAVLGGDRGLASLTASCLAPAAGRCGVDVLAPGLLVRLDEDQLVVDGDPTDSGRQVPAVDPRVEVDRAFMLAVRTGDSTPVRAPYGEALLTHRLAVSIAEAASGARGAPGASR